MEKLKEAYELKKQLVTSDINELGNILKESSSIKTINVNPDNTIYLESNCGIDSIKDDLDEGIRRWIWVDDKAIRNIVFITLPISSNSCIIKI